MDGPRAAGAAAGVLVFVVGAVLWVGAGYADQSAVAAPSAVQHASSGAAVRQWMEMRHVDVRLADSATVRVRWLRGEVLRTHAAQPAALGDPSSFKIRVTDGVVSFTGADLGALLNGVVFAQRGAALRDMRVHTDSGDLLVTGTVHKIVNFHFEARAMATLQGDGRVRVHASMVHVLGLSAEKVLHTLGLHLADVVDVSHAPGVVIDQDDVLIDPFAVMPPPTAGGRIRAIHVGKAGVMVEFAHSPDDSLFKHSPDSAWSAPGFVDFHGGMLEVGHLAMQDANLRIGDRDSLGSFDLSLPHYMAQLTHGYFRMGDDFGVIARVPDFTALGMPPATRSRPSRAAATPTPASRSDTCSRAGCAADNPGAPAQLPRNPPPARPR